MKMHQTIIVEHYSRYLNRKNINISITRKNLYWEPKEAELVEAARIKLELKKSEQLSEEARAEIELLAMFSYST